MISRRPAEKVPFSVGMLANGPVRLWGTTERDFGAMRALRRKNKNKTETHDQAHIIHTIVGKAKQRQTGANAALPLPCSSLRDFFRHCVRTSVATPKDRESLCFCFDTRVHSPGS